MEVIATSNIAENQPSTAHAEPEVHAATSKSTGLMLDTTALDDSADAYGMAFFSVHSAKATVAHSPDHEVLF